MKKLLIIISLLSVTACTSTNGNRSLSRHSSYQSQVFIENSMYSENTEDEKRIAQKAANQAALDCQAEVYSQLGVFQAQAVTHHRSANNCGTASSIGGAFNCGVQSATADSQSRNRARQAAQNYNAASKTIYLSCLGRKGWRITNRSPN